MEKENETLKTQFFPKVIKHDHATAAVYLVCGPEAHTEWQLAPAAADTASLTASTGGITVAEWWETEPRPRVCWASTFPLNSTSSTPSFQTP